MGATRGDRYVAAAGCRGNGCFPCRRRRASPPQSWHTHVPHAFFLDRRVGDEAADFGGGRVDGGEAEDVEEDEAAVVDEVLDCFAGEGEVGVGEVGDAGDAVDAVDEGEDAGEGEV